MENLEDSLTFCIKIRHYAVINIEWLKQKTKLSISSDKREYHLENKHGGAHGEELANLMIKVWFIVIVL